MGLAEATRFVNSLPLGSGEREYHGAILSIVSGITFDEHSVGCGVGLLEVLTYDSFVGAGIDFDTHPFSGSLTENSHFVAALFSKAQLDWVIWKQESLTGDLSHSRWVEWWREQFRKSPLVSEIK